MPNLEDKDDAMEQLQELRSRGGNTQSKYKPWLEEMQEMGEDEVLIETVDGYGKVSAFRRYVDANAEQEFTIRAAREEGEEDKDKMDATYRVFGFKGNPDE